MPDRDGAAEFLEEAAGCEGQSYDSPGRGKDWRFEGERMVGSGLTCEKVLIHAAFFRMEEEDGEGSGRMSSFRRRREFRR